MCGKIHCLRTGKGQNNMIKRAKANPVISEFTEREVEPMWKPNSLIRCLTTGSVMLVIEAHSRYTTVVDPMEKEELVVPKVLLERQYSYWVRDIDSENTDPINYEGEWQQTPMII